MSDPTNSPASVTIVKERSSGGTIFLGILAVIVIAIGAYFLFGQSRPVDPADASITAAAEKVGDAADKVGAAAQDAANNVR